MGCGPSTAGARQTNRPHRVTIVSAAQQDGGGDGQRTGNKLVRHPSLVHSDTYDESQGGPGGGLLSPPGSFARRKQQPFYESRAFLEAMNEDAERNVGGWGWTKDTDTPDAEHIDTGDAHAHAPPPKLDALGLSAAYSFSAPTQVSSTYTETEDATNEASSVGSFEVGNAADASNILFRMAAHGHVDDMTRLIDAGCDVNVTNDAGQAPLHLAAIEGHLNCVTILVRAGARVNAADNNSITPLQAATRAFHNDVTAYLLDNGGVVVEPEVPAIVVPGSGGVVLSPRGPEAADPKAILARQFFNKMLDFARLPLRANVVPTVAVMVFLQQSLGLNVAVHEALRRTLVGLSEPLDLQANPRQALPPPVSDGATLITVQTEAEDYTTMLDAWQRNPLKQVQLAHRPTAKHRRRLIRAQSVLPSMVQVYKELAEAVGGPVVSHCTLSHESSPLDRHLPPMQIMSRTPSLLYLSTPTHGTAAPRPPLAPPLRFNPRQVSSAGAGPRSIMRSSLGRKSGISVPDDLLSHPSRDEPSTASAGPKACSFCGDDPATPATSRFSVIHFESFYAHVKKRTQRGPLRRGASFYGDGESVCSMWDLSPQMLPDASKPPCPSDDLLAARSGSRDFGFPKVESPRGAARPGSRASRMSRSFHSPRGAGYAAPQTSGDLASDRDPGVRKHCPLTRLVLQKTTLTNWMGFAARIQAILRDVLSEFPEVPPASVALAITTVDGQQVHFGPSDYEPMYAHSQLYSYADVVEKLGLDAVNTYVGQSVGRGEEDGRPADLDFLLSNKKPSNAATDGGTMLLLSLLDHDDVEGEMHDVRLERYTTYLRSLTGGVPVTMNDDVCAAEMKVAYHTFAVANFLAAQKCFPPSRKPTHTFIRKLVHYYIKTYSLQTTPQGYATMCATLANFGVCPLTNDKIVSYETVKASLQLLSISGLGTFTGQWACTVGIPASSSKTGVINMIIPGSMGICVRSPVLDKHGNSAIGVRFAQKFSERFRGGSLDQLYFGGQLGT